MPRINSREFNGETRAQVKERLTMLGLWGKFWRQRDKLAKERGDTNGNEAMMLLVLKVPYRKDTTAAELIEHGAPADKVKAWFEFKASVQEAAGMTAPATTEDIAGADTHPTDQPSVEKPPEASAPAKKRGPGRPKGAKNKPKVTTEAGKKVAETAAAMDGAMPETLAAAKGGSTYQQGAYVEPPASRGSRGNPWVGDLTMADVASKPQITVRRAVEWVFESFTVRDVTAEDAPSAGAWALLKWARSTPTNQSDFYKSFSSKMLPSRQQLDQEERKSDDASGVDETIEHLLGVSDAIQSDGSQAFEAQPVVGTEPAVSA